MNRRTAALVFLALFLAAWLPRTLGLDVFVTADERKWMTRSANFAYALAHGDLRQTYQREHPAVTNTYLGALGVLAVMPDYAQRAPGYFNPDIEDWEHWLAANTEADPLDMLASARGWTVLVVALLLAFTWFPMRRLFGDLPALVGGLFVALSPMAIAYSRQVQPDGLHSVFLYAALVFFLSWLYGERGHVGEHCRNLWASGILMGLGWLTKTPVLFLALIGGLLVLGEWWRRRVSPSPAHPPAPSPPHSLFLGYILWGVIASAVFFLLWPAMWIDPVGIFTKMYLEMTVYIEGHINPNFFMGQVTQDPGPIFYPLQRGAVGAGRQVVCQPAQLRCRQPAPA